MARIRSVKPEYWKSEAITRLSRSARLTFIALWSYVDDNGVGIDNEKLIAAELMPLEDDAADARRIIREDVAELARECRVVRYTVSGRSYLFITGWDEHQKIDKPNKTRYLRPDSAEAVAEPLTSGNPEPPETLAQHSRNTRATPSTGAVEQRNRGAGEQRSRGVENLRNPTGSAHDDITTQTIIAEWIEHCRERPPGRVVGQLSKEVATLIAEGIDPGKVRVGTAAWATKGLHPATLASVVHETMNGNGQVKPSTTNQRVAQALALATEYEARGE